MADKNKLLKSIKKDIQEQNFTEVFLSLNNISDPEDDFILQHKYASILNSIPKNALNLKEVRIAILASSTTSHFTEVLKYWLAQVGLSAIIYEAEYHTITQSILDSASALYTFNPDITMIFTNYRDVKCSTIQGCSVEEVHKSVKEAVREYILLWEHLQKNSATFIIQNNADIPAHRVLGNYEGTALWSNVNILRAFNLELAKEVRSGVTIFDLDYLSSLYGKRKWHDNRFWYHSKHAFSLDATGLVAFEAAKLIGSAKGFSKKCLVLDLDNTLWGGIIGDDGINGITLGSGAAGEAFVEFQKYLLHLKNRGIILTICSKNEEDAAKEPFLHHPDMQIRLDDIAVFKANWNNKADNIKLIANELNIGLEHMVFVDDNPAEREIIRTFLPMVTVPEMPSDPSEYIKELCRQSYFEIISFSEADLARSNYYQENASREKLKTESSDLSAYLKNLQMEATVANFDQLNLARVAQLINKSNQFHLTSTRYTESQLVTMMQEKRRHCRHFRLKDRFGDNGLISVVITEEQEEDILFIDTWVMSCRVFSRGMEQFVANEIISLARKLKAKSIRGKYTPTKKNKIVSDLYEKLHFSLLKEDDEISFWELPLTEKLPKYETFIKKVTAD